MLLSVALIGLAVLIQTVLVALIELQRATHRLHDGSRRDGCAGERIEVAAVPAHGPALLRRFRQRQAPKSIQPAGIAILERVAQSGCFIVTNDLHAEQLAAGRNGDQQFHAVRDSRRAQSSGWRPRRAVRPCACDTR